MSSGEAVFRRIQSLARSTAAKSGIGTPTQEYLIRHTLESSLDRLTRTSHAGEFVLKASTRWRDYVDIVQLAHHGIAAAELLRSA